jgi:hypothetical protein
MLHVRWGALLLALAWATSAAADEPPIRLQVNAKIAQSPATIHGKVIIERNPDNRLLVLMLDSENYSTRSDYQLEGEGAARVYDRWWKDLPCGSYEARAVLVRIENGRQVEKHATEHFQILGVFCP